MRLGSSGALALVSPIAARYWSIEICTSSAPAALFTMTRFAARYGPREPYMAFSLALGGLGGGVGSGLVLAVLVHDLGFCELVLWLLIICRDGYSGMAIEHVIFDYS